MHARLIRYGDRALLVETPDTRSAHRVARAIVQARDHARAPATIEEVVVGLASVVIVFDPHDDGDFLEQWVETLSASAAASTDADGHDGSRRPDATPFEVPTVFDGPDLATVAADVKTTTDAIVTMLTTADLEVAFVGFAPGFPYLVGLPDELAAVTRRATPRPAVPAGSVAVGGGFASVYPTASPGGWRLLGRTSTPLFDPEHPPYARLRPGDAVHFTVADASGVAPAVTASARGPLRAGGRYAEVVEPGLLTLVEDGGRRSLGGAGVPRAGPCDPETMGLVNRLLGNAADAAALEITAAGPSLRLSCDTHVAVVASGPGSAEATVDGFAVASGTVVPVRSGQEVAVGAVREVLRAYLGVAGGFETPVVVGSRSSDLLSGLGPGPLCRGDRLGLGAPVRPRGLLTPDPAAIEPGEPVVVRLLAGPHGFAPDQLDQLVARTWTVGADSNRIGLRLDSGSARLVPPPPPASVGMVTGAVQIPPDGRPIVLMPDHATIGGYPVVGCVIAADLPLLGRLRPGDALCFGWVDPPAARRALRERDRAGATRVRGWFPTAS
jgi:KipI family sensor histidine kinase inhibitor